MDLAWLSCPAFYTAGGALGNECDESISRSGDWAVVSQGCLGKGSKVEFSAALNPSMGPRKTGTFSLCYDPGTGLDFQGPHCLKPQL